MVQKRKMRSFVTTDTAFNTLNEMTYILTYMLLQSCFLKFLRKHFIVYNLHIRDTTSF